MFEKNERKSPFSGKKVLGYKKTGIAKAKKYKNRIYLRKKGNNKKRKKKDFFPPLFTIIFKLKNDNFKTRDFSPLIERVLAGVRDFQKRGIGM